MIHGMSGRKMEEEADVEKKRLNTSVIQVFHRLSPVSRSSVCVCVSCPALFPPMTRVCVDGEDMVLSSGEMYLSISLPARVLLDETLVSPPIP